METLRLPLPQNPNAGLRRAHWATRLRAQKAWIEAAAAAIEFRFPNEPFELARVQCRFFVRNLCDADNLAARQKWILDFLTASKVLSGVGAVGEIRRAGWIVDDSPRHLILGEPEQEIDRREPRVEVTIEEVQP